MNISYKDEILSVQPFPDGDLWRYLQRQNRPIVCYGMGNGADKLLAACTRFRIPIADFFASDDFVRGQSFHGKRVLTYAEVRKKYASPIILVAFGTRIPEVMDRIRRMGVENELYLPDVPAFGDLFFDYDFFLAHEKELEEARALFDDERSRTLFDDMIRYKLSGAIRFLDNDVSCDAEIMKTVLHPDNYRVTVDLGAYNGDSVRSLMPYCPHLERVYAFEPDARNYAKLKNWAGTQSLDVRPFPYAAWDKDETLAFSSSGNRNSTGAGAGASREAKARTAEGRRPDGVINEDVDFIKFDVEGSEREALDGCRGLISERLPEMLVSAYHRSDDLFVLPRLIREISPEYRLFLRRHDCFPAWELNIYAVK